MSTVTNFQTFSYYYCESTVIDWEKNLRRLMLRYILSIRVLASIPIMRAVDFPQALLNEKCPCLVSHTCPKHSKCSIERNIERISDRLNNRLHPSRKSSCSGECNDINTGRTGVSSAPGDSKVTGTSFPSNTEIPITLTRSQLRQIRRAAQKLNTSGDCWNQDCVRDGPRNAAHQLLDSSPAYITRVVTPMHLSTTEHPTSVETTVASPSVTPTTIRDEP